MFLCSVFADAGESDFMAYG